MKKGILILVLVCFAFLLSSCSENNVSVDTKTESTTTTTNQTTITTSKQKYEVSFIVNGEEHDSLECNGKEAITLPDEPAKTGYDFVGWFYEDTFITEFKANSLVNNNINNDISVYAKLNIIDYAISYINTKGVTHNNPTSYNVETNTITLTNLSKDGYEFDGWYNGNTKVTTIPKGSTGNITLEARWIVTAALYTRDGDYIYFGEYPQTKVSDETIITSLTALQGTLPNSTNSQTWTSYGYYQGTGSVGTETNTTNYMWYKDVTYNNEQYRGVYFTNYRPTDTYGSSSTGDSHQDENGYETSNVYWFKFEPIKWRILKEANNEALLLCEMIIDSQDFYPHESDRTIEGKTIYANNWEYSTIRSWLNDNFYNTAFSTLQKELIITQTLDNQTTAINGSSNIYATCQNNTEDNIYLLSYQDMVNVDYGFIAYYTERDVVRQKKTTDYAQAQGSYIDTRACPGNSFWRLRSPDSYRVSDMYSTGSASSGCVNKPYIGVAPALTIRLS